MHMTMHTTHIYTSHLWLAHYNHCSSNAVPLDHPLIVTRPPIIVVQFREWLSYNNANKVEKVSSIRTNVLHRQQTHKVVPPHCCPCSQADY